ncbi:MAG: DUF4167 domain-containing protein [Rhodospirillales bacterium]|nr:DUF4167 domain-containing protein [Rhodospirillales bacterium]
MTQQRRRRPSGGARNSNNSNGGRQGGGDPRRSFEKYNEMARAAEASGDHVARELYFQHADHYYRVMNERSQNATGPATEPEIPQSEI